MPAERLLVSKRAGHLVFEDQGGHESRHLSIRRLIEQANQTVGLPNFAPTMINTSDRPIGRRCLSFCTAAGYEDVPVPDFLFDSWPEVGVDDYQRTCREVAGSGRLRAACRVCGWVGNADTHPSRRVLLAVAGQSPLIDARHTPWPPDGTERLTLPHQVRAWGLLLDVQGNGWSARLKLLLHSGRPVLVADRPWREWWSSEFRPWEHYIPVRGDLSDLVPRVEWALSHPVEAAAIGLGGQRLARGLLTRGRAVAEWATILGRMA